MPPSSESEEDDQKPQFEHRIVLNEDKKYFPEMEEVYPGVETLVNEEDTQDISVPIIQNVNLKKFENFEKNVP